MATEQSLLLNIGEMIDLAIGTPEIGVVDFGMLHTVLHCLAQQQRVLGKNVQLKGSVAVLPLGREWAKTLDVSEYVVEPDGGKTTGDGKMAKKPEAGAALEPSSSQETILVVERRRKSEVPGLPRKSPEDFAGVGGGGGAGAGGGAGRGGGPGAGPGGKGGGGGGPGGKSGGGGGPGAKTGAKSKVRLEGDTGAEDEANAEAGTGALSPVHDFPSERLSLVTMSKFNVLEDVVKDLKERVYGSIPKNEEILEEVRSQTNLKSITDMWTSLNVSTRLEAAEAGIAKLGSLMEDLIADLNLPLNVAEGDPHHPRSLHSVFDETEKHDDQVSVAGKRVDETGKPADETKKSAVQTGAAGKGTDQTDETGKTDDGDGGMRRRASKGDSETNEELQAMKKQLARLREDLENLTNSFYSAVGDLTSSAALAESAMTQASRPSVRKPSAVDGGGKAPSESAKEEAVSRPALHKPSGIKDESAKEEAVSRPALNKPSGIKISAGTPSSGAMPLFSNADLVEWMNDLEKRFKQCCETVTKTDGVFEDTVCPLMNSFQDQLENLVKDVAGIRENLESGKLSPDLIKDLQGLLALFETVQDMQEQMKQVHETATQLASEKNERQKHMDTLIEQIELLKTIKLDREDMAEAMAEKADLRMLARKVSHDQFELACDDLSKGVEHALGKLNLQEALWQQALDDIQREIETKLDKMELSPVKEFFNTKLKQLQENLKKIASLRKQTEAAGTKKRLLQDVNCISCDANAVMRMETDSNLPVMKAMPPNMSMKPYLTYELDAIRKTQASNVPQRNLHDWEQIEKKPRPAAKRPKSENEKHLCNRYCGGSHTTTTAAQRVARLGHFVKQWGPDVVPLSSGMAAGDDGRLYKVSGTEGAAVGPDPGKPVCTPKVDNVTKGPDPTHKPLISSECRCLDGEKK